MDNYPLENMWDLEERNSTLCQFELNRFADSSKINDGHLKWDQCNHHPFVVDSMANNDMEAAKSENTFQYRHFATTNEEYNRIIVDGWSDMHVCVCWHMRAREKPIR